MKSVRTALLLGATGLVGGHCLELLLEDDAYEKVVSIGRRKSRHEHAKLIHHTVDFERLDDSAHLFHCDDLFCCLGTTIKKAGSQDAFRMVDFTYVRESARLASEQGTEQFLLVSALGADAHSRIFYNRIKGEVEEAVARFPFHGVHIFRPSLLLGERAEFRAGEVVAEKAMKVFSLFLVGRLRKYRAVRALTVARAMIKAARRQAACVNIFESDRIAEMAGEN